MALGEAHAVRRAAGGDAARGGAGAAAHRHAHRAAGADGLGDPPARDEVAEAREAIEDIVSRYTGRAPAKVSFRDADLGRVALIDVLLPADQPLPSAHRRAGDIEEAVRARCPELADVIVHTEPATASTRTG